MEVMMKEKFDSVNRVFLARFGLKIKENATVTRNSRKNPVFKMV